MAKPKYNKYTMSLPASHNWKCSPGHRLFVADRGAVRFEFPEAWMHGPEDDGSIGFHDRKPPDDDVSLKVTVIRLPPGASMADLDRELPLDRMLLASLDRPDRDGACDGVVHRVAKPDAEVIWVEATSRDKEQDRMIRSRMCLSRARGVQPLITMDCWADMTEQFDPVWDHLMATLWVAVPVDITGHSAN